MATLEFLPAGRKIDVPGGTELSLAAHRAGVALPLPCGGAGTCGDCRVRVVSGHVLAGPGAEAHHGKATSETDGAQSAEAWVKACQALTLDTDAVIEIGVPHAATQPAEAGCEEPVDRIWTEPAEQAVAVGEDPPLLRRVDVEVPAPQPEDGLSDWDRTQRALSACEGQRAVARLDVSLPLLRRLADTLRLDGGRIRAVMHGHGPGARLVRLDPGGSRERLVGAAIDLGTTTVALALVDLESRRVLWRGSTWNPQVSLGLDVISRINYARKPAGLEQLRAKALEAIGRLLDSALKETQTEPREVVSALVSGNTVMTHLLLGLAPESLRIAPYSPTLLGFPPLRARDVGLDALGCAAVFVSPCVGSYVGGDITAAMLCVEEAFAADEPSLLLDIGTNGELVVGNRDFLLACACSAGPAFEGGGVSCGMRAVRGAISGVRVDAASGEPVLAVLGPDGVGDPAEPPAGICGSGIIELVAGLFTKGWLDNAGRLRPDRSCRRLTRRGRRMRYTLAYPFESATRRELYVDDSDIENVLRTKAAIYAAASLLLGHVGLGFGDIEHFFIAGSFGRHLPMREAVILGLLPDVSPERFTYLGNASLDGSVRALLSADAWQRQATTAQRMTYLDLGSDPAYHAQFTAASFLPHTDFRLFPSVPSGTGQGKLL